MRLKRNYKVGDEVEFLFPNGEYKVGIIQKIFNINENWPHFYNVDEFFRTQPWYEVKWQEKKLNVCECYVL